MPELELIVKKIAPAHVTLVLIRRANNARFARARINRKKLGLAHVTLVLIRRANNRRLAEPEFSAKDRACSTNPLRDKYPELGLLGCAILILVSSPEGLSNPTVFRAFASPI